MVQSNVILADVVILMLIYMGQFFVVILVDMCIVDCMQQYGFRIDGINNALCRWYCTIDVFYL